MTDSNAEWADLKARARELLIACARAPNPVITYTDFVSMLGVPRSPHWSSRMTRLLTEIAQEEHAAGRGMLTAVVAHKTGDRRPGTKFFETAESLGLDVSDRTACWVAELRKVCGAWNKP